MSSDGVGTSAQAGERQDNGKGKAHLIHFQLDGEPETTDQEFLTPNEIIKDFGKKDPATNYLVQIKGHEQISYKDKGEIPIQIENGQRFQIVSTGPTPVSDAVIKTGVPVFIDGLKQMGFTPTTLDGQPDHVIFDYTVPGGKFVGKQLRLGFVVPT